MNRNREGGFTLIELLVVTAMTASLVVITSFALQRFAQRQQLYGAHDGMVTQLRQVQQRAVAVSHPSVFGAWFATGANSDWGPVEYIPDDPATGADETDCVPRGERDFDTGPFDSGDITVTVLDVEADPIADFCEGRIAGAEEVVVFFPRGDATAATVVIQHDRIGICRTIRILRLTGRVQGGEGGC